MSDQNRENRSIDMMTKRHRGRSSCYSVVSARSDSGGVKRRNHFTTTEPKSGAYTLRSDNRGTNVPHKFAVKRGGKVLGTYPTMGQAESFAFQFRGYVTIL